MSDTRLVALLQLCDSLFPIGSFAHSDGLEQATASGRVTNAGELRGWLDAQLAGPLATADGRAAALALDHWQARRWADLDDLDDEIHALRPASASREAARAMGTRLLKTWIAARPDAGIGAYLDRRAPGGVTLPVAFGIACAAAGIAPAAALEAFLYTRLAGAISAAMRLMKIGQNEAHRVLAEVLEQAPAAAAAIVASGAPPAVFAPALDIAAMSQQYQRSRLFRS
ncbi:MAG TPA: urease accessory UreF family protein [Vicinamibacterales bacterium]|jgi:urease accessory protein